MKTILGLDLGTNSIGWALIEQDFESKTGKIIKAGSRIIPMSQDILGKFDGGVSVSQTAERTGFRGVRRLRERHLLRRERLHRVLNILKFLPLHYSNEIDFEKKYGQFIIEKEPKINYKPISTGERNGFEFLFKASFDEMVNEFKVSQPQLFYTKNNGEETKIPYDWTIYYLRKKALTQKIEKEELAWLLLNFNQKRGYFQLRGEEVEENPNKLIEFHALKVLEVKKDENNIKNKDEAWYHVKLENGWIYPRKSKTTIDNWVGKTKEFIVTTDLDEDGNIKKDKEGKERRSFRSPDENDWTLVKKKTEHEIGLSQKTVGTFIYDTLRNNPTQKINGKLVRTIERKFYKSELIAILNEQKKHHPEFNDTEIYSNCIEELYQNNEAHKSSIGTRDFTHLFVNDIIFYQRPLKSKKSLISDCKFESRIFMKNGEKITQPIKCIAKSHPLYQEFRLWQWLQNLKIYEIESDKEVTTEILSSTKKRTELYKWLNDRKEIDHKALFNYLLKPLKLNIAKYRWNYVYDPISKESKSYPCNKTRNLIINKLGKEKCEDFLTLENEIRIWEFLYSVQNKEEAEQALIPKEQREAKKTKESQFSLSTMLLANGFDQNEINGLVNLKLDEKNYGSYSTKAIKKLLALIRPEGYWKKENIDAKTLDRIDKIISGEFNSEIRIRVREKAINLSDITHFQGLPLWLVSYIVYDRHSEDGEAKHWKTPKDIEDYLRFTFKQHEYRNPIVEQVITETLRIVKDIWEKLGKGQEKFFDEIHVELGRELKNPADKRKQITTQNNENENTNLRIKALLMEFMNDCGIESVRPYSPSQQEILKIYEDGVLNSDVEIPEDILKISKQAQPTKSDIIRYKLWLEQKYRSPYTGEAIPLSKLFTSAYEIEHIIPQSRYFDDSFSNKVICEAKVNSEKDKLLAYEFISERGGEKIEIGFGKTVTVFTKEQFEDFVKDNYAKNKGKAKKLMLEEIPEAFVQRQLNDTRYISKVIKNLLSNVVRENDEQEAISKNVITVTGAITSQLKQDWGLNDVWNTLITPRFERLNQITNSNNFGEWTTKEGKKVFQTQMPIELQRGFSKKRIDHRHHSLDAIVIAMATRNHVNYLNNTNALGKEKKEIKEQKRHDLKHLLCEKKINSDNPKNFRWQFVKPWATITEDTQECLNSIVVSFKQNLRVINKTVNYYQKWVNENGKFVKKLEKQNKGDNWAVRKPLHKETVSGLVKLRKTKEVSLSVALENWEDITNKYLRKKIKELVALRYDKKLLQKFFKDKENKWENQDISRVEIFYWENENVASRVKLDDSFNSNKIESVTDWGIQKILLAHLAKYNEIKNDIIIEHSDLAFSAEGIDDMNKSIISLNNEKRHQPILKVRTYEPKGNKFAVGTTHNKNDKFVEAAKGTNLFFAIYQNENGKRNYDTIPLNIVIERLKQGLIPVPEKNKKGDSLLMYLSPNDLVSILIDDTNIEIFKFVSCTGSEGHFVPLWYSKDIIKNEMGTNNKSERPSCPTGFNKNIMIKECCFKLKIDRLGNIIKI